MDTQKGLIAKLLNTSVVSQFLDSVIPLLGQEGWLRIKKKLRSDL